MELKADNVRAEYRRLWREELWAALCKRSNLIKLQVRLTFQTETVELFKLRKEVRLRKMKS